jgi:hypothetical protein
MICIVVMNQLLFNTSPVAPPHQVVTRDNYIFYVLCGCYTLDYLTYKWETESSVVCLNILWWEEQEWTNIGIAHVICLEAES